MTADIPEGYRVMTITQLPEYLSQHLPTDQLPDGDPKTWSVDEIGDGNLNLVFIVSGTQRAIVIKQALPYVRAAGDSWPLSIKRAYFEYEALTIQRRFAEKYVPRVYFYDPTLALFGMEYLHPYKILRKSLINGDYYLHLAEDIGVFLAQTLFFTSDLAMSTHEKKSLVAKFAHNIELCQITEDLIFTEPYYNAPRNNWHSPALDTTVQKIWQDNEMIDVVMEYKWKFMTETQALLHADLHTGSIMVTPVETKIIDPEFSFYGPMAFDIGNYLGNLLMAYFSQLAYQNNTAHCKEYQHYLLQQIVLTWTIFKKKFTELWNNKRQNMPHDSALAWPTILYPQTATGNQLYRNSQRRFFKQLFHDSLVNAGLEINRRIIGFAGVADLNNIKNPEIRACCEHRCLTLARHLIVHAAQFSYIDDVTDFAAQLEKNS